MRVAVGSYFQRKPLEERNGVLYVRRDTEFLYIDYRGVTQVDESIGRLTSLKELSCNDNQLTKLPESIGSLINLKEDTLKSLGDLELQLRNVDAARQHFYNALPLYKALGIQRGRANTLKSLGNLELQLRNMDAARQHFDNALPLYQAAL